MTAQPQPSEFARLLQKLTTCSGEALERALAESAPMFARLSARAAPRILGTPHLPTEYFTLARAQRELARLALCELTRLCELAAGANGDEDEMGLTQRDISELLKEELRCAKSLNCLPRSVRRRVRDQAQLLRLGVCDAPALQACAESIHAHAQRSR